MSYTAIAPLAKNPTSTSAMATELPSKVTKPRKSSKASTKASHKSASKTSDGPKSSEKTHRRSRSGKFTTKIGSLKWIDLIKSHYLGCFTCRLRRKKCDEGKPVCKACRNLKLTCEYQRPMWWGSNDERKAEKDSIKTIIKNTKLIEKATRSASRTNTPPSLSHSVSTPDPYPDGIIHSRAGSVDSRYSADYETNRFPAQDAYDPFASQLETPHFDTTTFYGTLPPYEVDVKTESQLFVNDVPTRRDSSTSCFNTFQPPMTHATLPPFPSDDWVQPEFMVEDRKLSFDGSEDSTSSGYNFFDFLHPPVHAPVIHVDECDRRFLDHFLDNVLRLIFPVLESRQQGTVRSDVVLPALESNKCYLHCCLSIAGVHLKSTEGISGEYIDNDILKHRYETISELCKALNRDTDHLQILEATLGLIFFPCSVGRPNDSLPDIPWHQHFQAATNLIHKLDLPRILLETDNLRVNPPFNMTLAAWIDILGSTMVAKTPQFAHTYRTKHLSGSSSGLCELMGCEDRVMYLISEISCLEALKLENRIDHIELCSHITALAQQLDHTEPLPGALQEPYSESGNVQSKQLSKNMTSLYRVAARVYLCSLVPGFDRNQPGTMNLISHFSEILDFIPPGSEGFDRSLVWPYLICGSFSTPESSFRAVFNKRIELLGEHAEFGSFGRMACLLREVWRIADNIPVNNAELLQKEGLTKPTTETVPTDSGVTTEEETQPRRQSVHWRDVMRQNRWEYLLI